MSKKLIELNGEVIELRISVSNFFGDICGRVTVFDPDVWVGDFCFKHDTVARFDDDAKRWVYSDLPS